MPQNDKQNGTGLKAFIISCIVVFATWILYPWLLSIFVSNFENRGTAGDLFGGFTALFSALAFAGLIYTLLIQKEELSLQRKELSELVEQQKNSNEQLDRQLNHLNIQRSEDIYFRILDEFQKCRSTIKYGKGSDKTEGRDALVKISNRVLESIKFAKSREEIELKYEKELGIFEPQLLPYFRLLNTALEFLDESGLDKKNFYASILRAHLSNSKLGLIMVNCSHGKGRNLEKLIRDFDILKHLSPNFKRSTGIENTFVKGFYLELFKEHSFTQNIDKK